MPLPYVNRLKRLSRTKEEGVVADWGGFEPPTP